MLTKRYFEKAIERVPIARRVSIWLADRRAAIWARRNPTKSYSDYYVDHVRQHLDRGKPHPTLGPQGFNHEVGSQVDWDRTNFANRGRNAWREYRAAGVTSGMRIVDYGCGSLRVGQHAIRFADRGNYWGIDVSDAFFNEGRKLLDPDLVEDKRPRMSTINDPLIDLIGVWQPHFIFSHTVIQHIPEADLPAYFERLSRMMGPGCIAMIEYIAAAVTFRIKAMSWAYCDADLLAAAKAVDPSLSIKFDAVADGTSRVMKKPRRVMILERVASVATASVAA